MKNKFLVFSFYCICFLAQSQEKALQFENVGPSRGGRVTAVSGVTDSTNVYYMGATGGGLWKTSDYGNHWENISDGYFESPSIGAIAVDQNYPNTVYVGTGSDGIRSNVIVGKGIYKSLDAGKTWAFSGLKKAGQIGALEIDPSNNQNIFSAVIGHPFKKSKERGVYRSNNGGETWDNVFFVSDSVGAVDIEFAPKNPNIIYAAMWRAERKPWTIISGDVTGGIFKSSDGGDSWKKITKGLPQGLIGKIDFAVSEDRPNWVWALIQAPTEEEGLYKSEDYGESWTYVTIPEDVKTSIMYRPFYFTNLNANPKNANQLWTGTKFLWTTKNGGADWSKIDAYTHEDHHAMWVNPKQPEYMIVGNDGGASVSINSGINFSTLFNQNTAELYSCYVDDQYPYYLYSGQQDNSTIRVPSKRPHEDVLASNGGHELSSVLYWESIGGCETGPVIPKPGNANIVYTNCKGQFGVYNHLTGFQQNYYIGAESLYGNHPDDITYRFQRVVPMAVSPFNPDVVYYGSQFVHKTTDGGLSWETISPDLTANKSKYRMRSGGPIDEDISGEEYYNVLYAIDESPIEQGVIWTGSNDGLIHVTLNGGKTWENVTPKRLPEDGRVSKIHASGHTKGKAYLAVNRDFLGDEKPYIYRTNDYGKSWKKIVSNIPSDFPARVVREDPIKSGLLYAGTEFGLYISFDDGDTWTSFQQNLPIVPITDIAVFRDNLNLSTLGRSFWIMEDVSVLRDYKTSDSSKIKIYKPSNSIGEHINVYFSSGNLPEDTPIEITYTNDLSEIIHQKSDTLKNFAKDELGLRKSVWDLRHYIKRVGEKDFFGPKVAPGTYNVSLSFEGKLFTESFQFKLHPELEEIGTSVSDLKEQESLALKTAKLFIEISSLRNALEKKLEIAENKNPEEIKEQIALLVKGKERYDKPMLENHTEYLYDMITQSPQKLGEDAFSRYDELYQAFQVFK